MDMCIVACFTNWDSTHLDIKIKRDKETDRFKDEELKR